MSSVSRNAAWYFKDEIAFSGICSFLEAEMEVIFNGILKLSAVPVPVVPASKWHNIRQEKVEELIVTRHSSEGASRDACDWRWWK